MKTKHNMPPKNPSQPMPPEPEMLEPILEATLLQTQETNTLLEALILQVKEINPDKALEALLVLINEVSNKFEAIKLQDDEYVEGCHVKMEALQNTVIELLQQIADKEVIIPPPQPVDMTDTNTLLAHLITEVQKPCETTITLELE